MVPATPDGLAGASSEIPEPVAADGSKSHENEENEEGEENEESEASEESELNEENFRLYQPLYEAAHAGDWTKAERIFRTDPEATTAILNVLKETVLHIATSMGRTEFVRRLVDLLPPEALELKECTGKTCLDYAAVYGSLEAAEILVNKNRRLTQIMNDSGDTPLAVAAYYSSKEVVLYLTSKTTDEPPGCPFTGPFADILLHLIGKYPNLATAIDPASEYGVLSALAHKSSDFPSGCTLNFWERCIYPLIDSAEADHSHLYSFTSDVEDPAVHTRISPTSRTFFHSQALQYVTRAGRRVLEYTGMQKLYGVFGLNHIKDEKHRHKCTQKLVKIACQEMLRSMTQTQIWKHFKRFEFHTSRGSKEAVFNLMLEKNELTKTLGNHLNESEQSVLHLVGKLAPYPQLSSVSCPALQMQRELQWFQAVEEFIHPLKSLALDNENHLARDLFTSEHKDLLRDAERWMKDTSNSCMIVATLIATVVFAAAFTVPGGNIDGKGIPVFLNEQVFMVFVIFDALALFSSTTSIVMFLSILTARYAEQDFLRALPTKLISGFASLFVAIATMMVAFGATLYMVLSERFKWIFIPIVAVTFIPIAAFITLQLPLFIYMVKSTYGRGIFRPTKIW